MKKLTDKIFAVLLILPLLTSCLGVIDGGSEFNEGLPQMSVGQDAEFITVSNMTKAICHNAGYQLEEQPTDTDALLLELADNNYDFNRKTGNGAHICLQLIAPLESGRIPEGVYVVTGPQVKMFREYDCLDGWIGPDKAYCGSWLFEGEKEPLSANEGYVYIRRDRDLYTIVYKMYDFRMRTLFTSTYIGEVLFD